MIFRAGLIQGISGKDHLVYEVEVRDQTGRQLGFVSLNFTSDEIDEARRRLASDEPRHTTCEVMEHLQNLDGQ